MLTVNLNILMLFIVYLLLFEHVIFICISIINILQFLFSQKYNYINQFVIFSYNN